MNDIRGAEAGASDAPPDDAVPVAVPSRAKVRPLLALLPYVMRYRGRVLAAFVALLVAATATLIVPLVIFALCAWRRPSGFDVSAMSAAKPLRLAERHSPAAPNQAPRPIVTD